MTNAPELLKIIHRRCQGGHEHGRLISGRAKDAAIYPPALCQAVVHGIKQQIAWDRKRHGDHAEQRQNENNLPEMTLLEIDDSDDEDMMPELVHDSDDEDEILAMGDDSSDGGVWEAEDDVKGGPLDPAKVHIARKIEMQYVWDRGIYKCVPIKLCKETTGKGPVGCKWIDTNKGDEQDPLYRSRLVATERRIHKRDSIFAATPPLESLRVLSLIHI
eukprot:3583818-Karenia_brevis.AAC.1